MATALPSETAAKIRLLFGDPNAHDADDRYDAWRQIRPIASRICFCC